MKAFSCSKLKKFKNCQGRNQIVSGTEKNSQGRNFFIFFYLTTLPPLIVIGPLIVFRGGGIKLETLSYSGADRLFGGYHKPKKSGYRRVSNSIRGYEFNFSDGNTPNLKGDTPNKLCRRG